MRLGFLALVPLVVSGLVTLSDQFEVAHIGALSFAIYAAALLSFLGGVRCGIEIMRDPVMAGPAAASVQRAARARAAGRWRCSWR